jgi:hypothetical protein
MSAQWPSEQFLRGRESNLPGIPAISMLGDTRACGGMHRVIKLLIQRLASFMSTNTLPNLRCSKQLPF